MNVSSLVSDLMDLLLPRGCVACGGRIPPEEGTELICLPCRTRLREPSAPRCPRCDVPMGSGVLPGSPCLECYRWPAVLSSARAAVILQPPADSLVHALKYRGWRSLGRFMGLRMARVAPWNGSRPLLVPVPTTPGRRRVRGYNQSRILAQEVSRATGAPMDDVLERPQGGSQVRSGPGERRANVERAFRLVRGAGSRIGDQEVILIDDVLTTGATALAAAEVLGRGGARTVRLLTFARALPFR